MTNYANIPMRIIGPIKITGSVLNEEVNVPLATFESPVWPSTSRGARISRLTDGIFTTIVDECMTRSIVLQAKNAQRAADVVADLHESKNAIQEVVSSTSRFAKLKDFHFQIVGNLLYLRFQFYTGDASGHNMTTKASTAIMHWILEKHPDLSYISVSGNYCTDKKASAVNGILGRGKYAVSEILIPRTICEKQLRTTPEKMVELNVKKNWIGTNIAGGLRSANAHFGNMLLALYLATGQDAVNIIEGSQGFVHTEIQNDDLYFSVTLPNVIVGTVGNGKDLEFVRENLKLLGCDKEFGARRLAAIASATVLCGELSLMAALTNQDELIRSHLVLERHEKKVTI